MPDVKISQLPQRSALSNDFVPVIDNAGTTTSRVLVSTIAAIGGGPPASHTHGNITNAGAIGTTADLPVKTGASGVLQAGAFGTAAGTFCQGNDSRLSDNRTPTSHASTHATGGTDPVQTIIPAVTEIGATVNDWWPQSGVGDIFMISAATTGYVINGIAATGKAAGTPGTGVRAHAILLSNTGANVISLGHQQSGSTAGNRIICPGAAAYAINPGYSVALFYDFVSSRWRVVA